VVKKGQDSGAARAEDGAGRVADRAQSDRRCLGPGGLGDDRVLRAKWIAKELDQARADS